MFCVCLETLWINKGESFSDVAKVRIKLRLMSLTY